MGLLARIRAPRRPGLMRACFQFIKKTDRRHAIGFLAVAVITGQAINSVEPLRNFHVYQVLFLPAIVIAVAEIRLFLRAVDNYAETTASHPSKSAGLFASRLVYSNWALPGVAVIGSLFVYSTISLEFIELNIMGYYALCVVTLIMTTSLLGQTCYVYYLIILRKILKSEELRYNFYFPAKTDWVKLVADMGSRLNNAFFVLGFIYTLVFFLNMPPGYVSISLDPWKVSLATPNNTVFIVSWAVIFVAIIMAFPTYAWAKSNLLEAIVEKLKEDSVAEVELLMKKAGVRGTSDVDMYLKYYSLIEKIEDSSAQPPRKFRLLPAFATASSITVHLIKISESFS